MSELATQLVNVQPNDVIVIRDDTLVGLSEKEVESFMKVFHEHFPKNLVIVLSDDDSLETQPIEVIRALLEDLIAHQEAVEQEG